MSRNRVYIRVLLVIISILVLLAFLNRGPRHNSNDSWLPSSYNPIGAGHMAFFQTLQEMHWPVERWREPLSRLASQGTGNVLVIARSGSVPRASFSHQEIDLLDNWVKAGNTLLLIGRLDEWDDTRDLLEQLGFKLPKKRDTFMELLQPLSDTKETLELLPAIGSEEKGTMILPSTESLPLTFPHGAHVLWQDNGQPYVIDVPRGGGHFICGASSDLLSNRGLVRGDNLAIVLRLLAPAGQVPHHLFFEESHHGFSAVYAAARLLNDPGLRFAGMLALLGALAFLGSSLVRFGQIRPLRHESGRSTLEFVDSIADLYLRADQRNDTMKYLFQETHQRILHRLNLPPTASHELIASRLAQGYPQLPKWKKLAQRFDSRDYVDGLPPTGWMRVATDLIKIKSAMA